MKLVRNCTDFIFCAPVHFQTTLTGILFALTVSFVTQKIVNKLFVFIFTDEEGSGEEVEIDESELPNTDYLKDIKHIKKEKRRKEKSKSKKDEK